MAAAPPNTNYALIDQDARFVDLDATGDMIVDGTAVVTGVLTATGGVVGAVTGAVTGNVTGNLTGAVTGNVTGDVTGDLTGDVTGDLTGDATGTLIGGQQDAVVAITGDGAITVAPSSIFLSKGSAGAITIVAPTTSTHDGYIIRVVAISAQAHVLTSATEGFNAKGSSGTATFGGAIGDSVTLIAYQGDWYTLANINVTIA